MGNMEAQQVELKKKLSTITVEAGVGGVKVTANANRELMNITLDAELFASDDKEQVEDLLVVCVNKALRLAAEKEGEATQALMQQMMGGMDMGALQGMFK